ncbi:hypothetical protein [Sagittula sp.]|uniref:hypothetical protein n=1 Tax=Sagittula sp. TaxID=2038081 RepID=UPI00351519B9
MAGFTTFREAAEKFDIDPENPDAIDLFLDALDLADERSELEFRIGELSEKIAGLTEQMRRVAAAEAAQQLTEIRTLKRKAGQ